MCLCDIQEPHLSMKQEPDYMYYGMTINAVLASSVKFETQG